VNLLCLTFNLGAFTVFVFVMALVTATALLARRDESSGAFP